LQKERDVCEADRVRFPSPCKEWDKRARLYGLFCIIGVQLQAGTLQCQHGKRRKENEKSGAVFFAIAYILNKPKFDLRSP